MILYNYLDCYLIGLEVTCEQAVVSPWVLTSYSNPLGGLGVVFRWYKISEVSIRCKELRLNLKLSKVFFLVTKNQFTNLWFEFMKKKEKIT